MVGVAILELSKFLMFKAWYKVIQPTATIAYMDTNSFIIHANG